MKIKEKGLARVKEIYQDRSRRVNELKAEGKNVMGFFCTYSPLEMLTALDLVPYRIHGDMKESVTEGDKGLQASFCPILRSCFDLALKSKYDFLDGIIAVHSCDPQEKAFHVWESLITYSYFHNMDLPCKTGTAADKYFKGELEDFRDSLQSFVGKELPGGKLRIAIDTHNQQRSLVRDLYSLTRSDPPLLSGVEIVQVIKALMSIPVEEGNEILREVITEVKTRKGGPERRSARILLWGSTIDDTALIGVIEDAGANIVIDDHCGGSRAYRTDVEITDDPLDGLARYYLNQPMCARTFREVAPGTMRRDYRADLESRFGYLKDYIQGWRVNGAILQLVRYCDPFGFEVVNIKDYFDTLGIPNIYLEHDYSWGALAALKTRAQAFVEVISDY